MIIDFHTHLGDVLYPNGGTIIGQGAVRKQIRFDPILLFEARQWRPTRGARVLARQMRKASMARSRTATLTNLQSAMRRNRVDLCVSLAVYPNVTFADLRQAQQQDARILPFTSVNFAAIEDVDAQFSADVDGGARGLKLHPILQKVPLNHPATFAAVEAFAVYGMPVLFHSGVAEYYVDQRDKQREAPAFGNIEDSAELIANFPNVNFVVGHAGLDAVDAVMQQLGHHKNVWVDISFQSPARIRHLLDTFGAERVLYGSDWPWGNMWASLNAVRTATSHDPALTRRILYANALELLHRVSLAAPASAKPGLPIPTPRRALVQHSGLRIE